MSTIRDLYDALISAPAGQKIEIDCASARAAETLRCDLVTRVSEYRKALDAVGVPQESQPQSVKFRYNEETATATVWLGMRELKPAKQLSFRILPPESN